MSETILIRGGRIIDPARNRDKVEDLFMRDGRIAPVPSVLPSDTRVVEAAGLVVAPGFIDLHVHLREPGGEEAETIASGTKAAARGGFTTVVAMPNTNPPTDSPERVKWVISRGNVHDNCRVIPAACLTVGRAGARDANLASLAEAGAGAFTDDGTTPTSVDVMERAMREAARLGMVVMDHAEDPQLERAGVMHLGDHSRKFGLPGIPSEAETSIVRRDIALVEKTGCALHIQHVSAAGTVQLIRDARKRGLRVSGELTPHHLALIDADIDPNNASFKMNPPLRSRDDRAALIDAVIDGTLETFATDHAPHPARAKAQGFMKAPPGIVGLETAIGVTYSELVASGLMDLQTWVRRWTSGPAAILGIARPSLSVGDVADIVVLNLNKSWIVEPEEFETLSRNTPFAGRSLIGRAAQTIRAGKIVFSEI